ncbi:MAG: hypothetical protein COV70_04370 [Parcubacteria group bacterium CG11_big_fil_rev_8_21_14_0_20_39_22]|nr:MAG: hypothetical protein COV70_04370 [Parcubacteria group bacterium CG11_big_fil_rev_8_21_14_0_20_39_22]
MNQKRSKSSNLSKNDSQDQDDQNIKDLQSFNSDLEDKVKERTAELNDLLKEQGKSAKMLIRRDLELTRANEKLQKVDEMKSSFISVVAHQLRTPLSGMKWTLSMVIAGDLGELNNEQKTFLMKAYESNTRMIALVNDMLVADRVQSERMRFRFKRVNIIDLIDNILFEISPQASKKNISISYKSKFQDIPQAYIDPETIRAVLQNLLENAIKYTIGGGKIEIDVKKDAEHLTISIADSGIGVPEEDKKNIFSKFFRARNAIKQETDGSGLGLYIAKTMVEKNGGKMWFNSVPGEGSTFYFTVPLK